MPDTPEWATVGADVAEYWQPSLEAHAKPTTIVKATAAQVETASGRKYWLTKTDGRGALKLVGMGTTALLPMTSPVVINAIALARLGHLRYEIDMALRNASGNAAGVLTKLDEIDSLTADVRSAIYALTSQV